MPTPRTVPARNTSYLPRPEGRLGYDIAGDGPLVVLVPGMGTCGSATASSPWRDAGYRVACTDLRGHGDSDATFTSYGDEETACLASGLRGGFTGSLIGVWLRRCVADQGRYAGRVR
jgi:pimeloyl-ACP methyl ester carboxylesterase